MKTTLGKRRAFGIDIGYASIKIIEVSPLTEDKVTIRQIHDIPVPTGMRSTDEDFPPFLRSHLETVIGHLQGTDLWGCISSEEVEMRCITIPAIPEKQMAKAVHWAFTKEVGHDFDRAVFDFEVIGEVIEEGAKKHQVIVVTVPKEIVSQRYQAFKQAGYPLTGISIIPFAIQNLIRRKIIPPEAKDMCHLYIGRNWSRIAIYSKGNLILSRGIKTGIKSMIEDIKETTIKKSHEKIFALEKDVLNSSDSEAQRLFFSCLIPQSSTDSSSKESDAPSCGLTLGMINPSLKRLVKQMERTFEHYILNFKSDGIGNIYISGILCQSSTIQSTIEKELEMPVRIMDPFKDHETLTAAASIPEDKAKREALIPCLGIALSQKAITPNFIFTYKDKAREKRLNQLNWVAFSFCMGILFGLCIYFFSLQSTLSEKKKTIASLNRTLQQYQVPTDQNTLLSLIAQSNASMERQKEFSLQLLPVAIIKEIMNATPEWIKLIKLSCDFHSTIKKVPLIQLEGIVMGKRSDWDAHLTRFGFHLNQSPLFGPPSIKKKKAMTTSTNQPALPFSITLSLLKTNP